MSQSIARYDYIIVGGGSAGAVLAARLSQKKDCTVCLLEAGQADKNPLIHIPFGLAFLSRVRSLNWGYSTQPQSHLNNRSLFWPRGKTLGGSSAINAMCYIRGQHSDYDDWEAQGAEGWSYDAVLPWFKKAEGFEGGASELHGAKGPLKVEALRHVDPLSSAFTRSGKDVGLPVIPDFNAHDRYGLGLYHVTQSQGERCSTSRAYLKPVRTRANLTILTGAHALKIILEKNRAVGVRVAQGDGNFDLYCNDEVIVSAGAINSPHLLMLSGIGPDSVLRHHKIQVNQALEGVGRNLQDHLDVIIQCQGRTRHGYALAPAKVGTYFRAAWQYVFKRKGLLSSNIAEAGGFACSSGASPDKPNLQFHFLPAILKDHGRQNVFGYGYGLHVCNLYPRSRGTVSLQSADPAVPPLIDPAYLSDEADLKVLTDGVKLARQLLRSEQMRPFFKTELLPGEEVEDDEALTRFIRQYAETIYHPAGTCKMGAPNDPMAVLDPQFRVYGTEGLRVVDASAMPTLVGGNTNAPVVMMAERAAAFIHDLPTPA
ncbi:GMC family oxidoreductase [Salinimonas chungwhensis]|uniref:GMC family oxidoreductase n=1 Tax=Salinimonas chungwhensis TaxID=265425 RepID=UPI00037B30E7|nr:choline dehydrogenase [Salinimonas chungwhensis]